MASAPDLELDWSRRFNNAARIARRDFVPEVADAPIKVLRLAAVLTAICAHCEMRLVGPHVCACGDYEHAEVHEHEWTIDLYATVASNYLCPVLLYEAPAPAR